MSQVSSRLGPVLSSSNRARCHRHSDICERRDPRPTDPQPEDPTQVRSPDPPGRWPGAGPHCLPEVPLEKIYFVQNHQMIFELFLLYAQSVHETFLIIFV